MMMTYRGATIMGQGVVALCDACFPGSAALEGDQLRHDYSGFHAERKIAAKILRITHKSKKANEINAISKKPYS
jgi:hypothetical protein